MHGNMVHGMLETLFILHIIGIYMNSNITLLPCLPCFNINNNNNNNNNKTVTVIK